ncbi:MAG: hypothetical protein BMS9Abin10_0761 [Gammaproteobacteria bacterium]|nr:MAG: hypothetical protein BMS9Abin10_0761 [Gammaproteobacteria bacterium]
MYSALGYYKVYYIFLRVLPRLPDFRIAAPVENTDYPDLLFAHDVEDAVGKPAKYGTAQFAVDLWIRTWILSDLGKASIESPPKA